MAILSDPEKLPNDFGANSQRNADYEQSANRELDRVFEQLTQAGLNPSDPWTLRLFLAELRKQLKAGGSVWAAVGAAISALVKQKESYLEAHKTGADEWPPHGKMPVRFGDPRQEIAGLLVGRTGNASRYVEAEQSKKLENNTFVE